MRIIPNKYPEENDVTKWLRFDNQEEAKISLVFARRLAALARDNNKVLIITEGLRTYERQMYFYNLYLSGKGNLAAKPDLKNGSQHQYGFAVDISDSNYWKNKSIREWMPFETLNQRTLNKYGLCLPMNNKDRRGLEWWHLVPIEVYNSNYSGDRYTFLQKDDKILNWDEEILKVKERTERARLITEILSGLISKKIITSPDYWRRVLEGSEIPKPEYLITVFQRLLK